MPKLETHQERQARCKSYGSANARCDFAALGEMRDKIQDALDTKEPFTAYQRNRMTQAVEWLDRAHTALFHFEQSCHADAQGYSIER